MADTNGAASEKPAPAGGTDPAAKDQPAQAAPGNSAPTEISNAEKKKRAKEEKAARRAGTKGGQPSSDAPSGTVPDQAAASASSQAPDTNTTAPATSAASGSGPKPGRAKPQEQQKAPPQTDRTPHARRASVSAPKADKPLTHRRRPSRSEPKDKDSEKEATSSQVAMFAHLYPAARHSALAGAGKEVHPAILALGVQLSTYAICGSQARCVALLLALKAVVQTYTTPSGTSLPRHLASQHLSSQLTHVRGARPFGVAQANAIRWLKNVVAQLDPGAAEGASKAAICGAIDAFVRERFTVADAVIAEAAAALVAPGDVVLTSGASAVVTRALLLAAARGTAFRAVVVDARPLHEGRRTAAALAAAGVDVAVCAPAGLAAAARGVSKCVLGAHAVLGNGAVQARAGTALAAMMAAARGAPVVVCAESVKFTDRVAVDAVVANELAPEDELVGARAGAALRGWRGHERLRLLNLMYDVTPAALVDVVVTELGSLPPASALVVEKINAGA